MKDDKLIKEFDNGLKLFKSYYSKKGWGYYIASEKLDIIERFNGSNNKDSAIEKASDFLNDFNYLAFGDVDGGLKVEKILLRKGHPVFKTEKDALNNHIDKKVAELTETIEKLKLQRK